MSKLKILMAAAVVALSSGVAQADMMDEVKDRRASAQQGVANVVNVIGSGNDAAAIKQLQLAQSQLQEARAILFAEQIKPMLPAKWTPQDIVLSNGEGEKIAGLGVTQQIETEVGETLVLRVITDPIGVHDFMMFMAEAPILEAIGGERVAMGEEDALILKGADGSVSVAMMSDSGDAIIQATGPSKDAAMALIDSVHHTSE